MAEYQITEEFTDATGRFLFYDTIDPAFQVALDGRQHINLRSFADDPDVIPQTMNYLDTLTLEGLTMAEIEADQQFILSEDWTDGTVGQYALLGNHNALVLDCISGANPTESALDAIDITGFEGTVSVALPDFPLADIDLAASNLTLTDGDTTVVLALSDSTTTLVAGDSEASWPISDLNGLTSVTTVTFNFTATGSCTVVVAALRLLGPDWTAMHEDIDTRHQRLEPIVNLDGSIPTDPFPVMWRTSDDPGSHADPRPFDSRVSFLFNSGSVTETNTITLYMRQRREDFLTQLDLDGFDLNDDDIVDLGDDQGILDNLGNQPDYGISSYDPTSQVDLEQLEQDDIDGTLQAFLERLSDTLHQSWIEATITWDASELTISTKNTEASESEAYSFTQPTLDVDTNYVWEVDLRDSTMRIQLFPIDSLGRIDKANPVFDSLELTDDFMFPRFKGRIGWSLAFGDGDVYLRSIRTQYLMFGEYRSHGFESRTPVTGARLYFSGSPDRQLYVGAKVYRNATVTIDESLSRSDDGSIRVTTTGTGGLESLPMVFNDFRNSQITFDMWYPATNFNAGIRPTLALANERGLFVNLPILHLQPEQWFHIDLVPLQAELQQTGSYKLMFIEGSTTPTTFWVDNISVRQRTIVWAGRAEAEDAFQQRPDRWTEFRDLVNTNNGILFPERGNFAQVRGRALAQDAFIEKVYFKPKYAELGRFVWNPRDRGYHSENAPVTRLRTLTTDPLTVDASLVADAHPLAVNALVTDTTGVATLTMEVRRPLTPSVTTTATALPSERKLLRPTITPGADFITTVEPGDFDLDLTTTATVDMDVTPAGTPGRWIDEFTTDNTGDYEFQLWAGIPTVHDGVLEDLDTGNPSFYVYNPDVTVSVSSGRTGLVSPSDPIRVGVKVNMSYSISDVRNSGDFAAGMFDSSWNYGVAAIVHNGGFGFPANSGSYWNLSLSANGPFDFTNPSNSNVLPQLEGDFWITIDLDYTEVTAAVWTTPPPYSGSIGSALQTLVYTTATSDGWSGSTLYPWLYGDNAQSAYMDDWFATIV